MFYFLVLGLLLLHADSHADMSNVKNFAIFKVFKINVIKYHNKFFRYKENLDPGETPHDTQFNCGGPNSQNLSQPSQITPQIQLQNTHRPHKTATLPSKFKFIHHSKFTTDISDFSPKQQLIINSTYFPINYNHSKSEIIHNSKLNYIHSKFHYISHSKFNVVNSIFSTNQQSLKIVSKTDPIQKF